MVIGLLVEFLNYWHEELARPVLVTTKVHSDAVCLKAYTP